MQDYENTLRHYLRDAQSQLEQIITETRRKKEPPAREVMKALHEVQTQLKRFRPEPSEKKMPVEDLKPGQRIKLSQVDREGIVIKVDTAARRAEILVGDRKIKAGFDAIECIRETPPAAPAPEEHTAGETYRNFLSIEDVPRSINVIGMTVDEALAIVDRAIDHALLRGAQQYRDHSRPGHRTAQRGHQDTP